MPSHTLGRATLYHHALMPDRRPIAARKLTVFIALARAIAKTGVSANAISVFGMFCGIGAGACFALTGFPMTAHLSTPLFLAGAAFIQFRLLCNMLDGMVAIESGKASPAGELYNEVPDRVSDLATLIGMGYAAGSSVELGYLAGALAVMVAYVRAAAKVAGAPQDFRGPMAKQQRMFLATCAAVFAALAPAAWQAPAFMRGWTVTQAVLAVVCLGCVWTIVRRVGRAAGMLRSAAP